MDCLEEPKIEEEASTAAGKNVPKKILEDSRLRANLPR